MGGDDGPGTNPEQLFAAGYSACFHSALRIVARRAKLEADNSVRQRQYHRALEILAGQSASGWPAPAAIPAGRPGVAKPKTGWSCKGEWQFSWVMYSLAQQSIRQLSQ